MPGMLAVAVPQRRYQAADMSTVSSALTPACVPVVRRLASFGVRVAIATSSRRELEAFERALPPFVAPTRATSAGARFAIRAPGRCRCGTTHDRYEVFIKRQPPRPTASLALAAEEARAAVKIHVAEFAPGRIFVHAGVVGWRGRVIVIPGRSYSGKTNLVRAFLAAGATYFSDEYAVLDRHGLVHPYPQPLGIRATGGLTQRDAEPTSLGAVVATEPGRIGLVVFTRFTEARRWRPTSTTPGQTVLGLLEHTVCAQRRPAQALDVIRRAIAHAKAVTGLRGEAALAAASILRAAW